MVDTSSTTEVGNRYVTSVDVLFGRGGHNNVYRMGNQRFLHERNRLYSQYHQNNASTNSAKLHIQNQLIQFVYRRNGQFLERIIDHTNNKTKENNNTTTTRWRVVTDQRKIYRKVAQALREGHGKYNYKKQT